MTAESLPINPGRERLIKQSGSTSSANNSNNKRRKKKTAIVHPPSARVLARQSALNELAELETRIKAGIEPDLTTFQALPLTRATFMGMKRGLDACNFVNMTEIQQSTLPLSLTGKDILGAAKTGSGKTLAFLLPVLEKLARAKWSKADGLGALIISPTRELALQIFQVLTKVGKCHSFSAGLLIGGKDYNEEALRIAGMNILVCTPGRLLQHMDQSHDFRCDGLQVLVLDEADRIMDAGFEKTVNAIIENLPPTRQTLLFSATQTKSVRDLARLSLKDPEWVAVHDAPNADGTSTSTPAKLLQRWVQTPVERKLDVLFSFIKSHLKSKMIIFLSSCKQVRFVYETFCKLQPGIPLMSLFGKQKQMKRLAIFNQFCRKTQVCLICTDVAARGLDFPAVDWVIQVDCPEDIETYIHRVGRTARYEAEGNSLLMLTPSEQAPFLAHLERKHIPVSEIAINPEKVLSITRQLTSFCTEYPEIKYLGQKHFISYYRSIYLKKDKAVFDINSIDANAFAASLGLPGTPKIKIGSKTAANVAKNNPRPAGVQSVNDVAAVDQLHKDAEDEEMQSSKKAVSKVDKMFAKKNLTVLSSHYQKLRDGGASGLKDDGSDDEGGDFLTLAREDHGLEDVVDVEARDEAKLSRKALKNAKSTRVLFDVDGERVADTLKLILEETSSMTAEELKARQASVLASRLKRMTEADVEDKLASKQRLKEKKKLVKAKEKEERRAQSGDGVILAASSDSDDEPGDSDDGASYSGDFSSGSESANDWSGSDDSASNDDVISSENERQSHASVKRKRSSGADNEFSAKKIKDMEAMALGLLDS